MKYGFDEFIREFRNAHSVAVLTGAGISAESGVPTFRGKDGIWDKTPIDEVATLGALERNPVRVWEWFLELRGTLRDCKPNTAHTALAKLEEHFDEFTVITQNIDNYHRIAGSRNVVELHGNAWWNICMSCGARYEDDKVEYERLPPMCDCGGLLKPDVVFFGEQLPIDAIERALKAAQECDFLLVVGTSAVVVPAATIPYYTHAAGGKVIEFNLEPTGHSSLAELSFFEKATSSLGRVIEAME